MSGHSRSLLALGIATVFGTSPLAARAQGAAESQKAAQPSTAISPPSGDTASQRTNTEQAARAAYERALAAYPGGVVDRVVKVSNGECEVHYIGVNWPHHIFVDHSFKVVGAD